MKKDFEFIAQIANDFFDQDHIHGTLSHILNFGISGWEKWVQIEFAKFCQLHDEISEFGREIRYELDGRMSRQKLTCSIDFLLRQKRKHSPMGIEFKQSQSAKICIRQMFDDVLKVQKIKYSQDDLRSIWCIGIHLFEPKESIIDIVMNNAEKTGVLINEDLIFFKKIKNSGFSVTIF